jgi:hypothetical protein
VGYEVHISRRENWFDDEGPGITAAEFEAAVNQSPDLVLVPFPDGWQGSRAPVAELASDTQHHQESGLYWQAGNIRSKNPSNLVIDAMCALARALNARVQDEDGELYGDHDPNP